MNQINFLPENFRRARRRQRRRPLEFATIAGTVLALVLLYLASSGPDATLADRSRELDRQMQAIDKLYQEQTRLDKRRSSLQRKLQVARETYQPITVTQVLARLSRHAPEPVRLIYFELGTTRPDPEPMAQPDAGQRNKKVIGKAEQANATRDPHLMELSIQGQAPSDEELVKLIRRLDADPVFTSVSLRSSRLTKTKTHFTREFRIELEIDLHRRFVPADEEGGSEDED